VFACTVSEDYDKDMALTETTGAYQNSYSLPDGNIVMLQRERFKTAEIMFHPDAIPGTVASIFDGKPPFSLQVNLVLPWSNMTVSLEFFPQ
jgi:Actin